MRTGLLLESLGIPLAFPIIYPLPVLPHPRRAHPPKPSPQALSLYLLAAFASQLYRRATGLSSFPVESQDQDRSMRLYCADYFVSLNSSCHVGNLQAGNAVADFARRVLLLLVTLFIPSRYRVFVSHRNPTVSRDRICMSLEISCSNA